MDRPILLGMVGLPRSGKSTRAKALAGRYGAPMVNPDSIRLALHGRDYFGAAEPMVWAVAKTMARSLFIAGHKLVILDATNVTRQRRDEWGSRDWNSVWLYVPCLVTTCLGRAPAGGVLQDVINRMAREFEGLGADEMRWEDVKEDFES
jgi:predicted kinase